MVRKAVDPPGQARPDWQVICDLSTRFGLPMSYESPRQIFDEIATLTPSYAGLDYDRLDKGPIAWPCPSKDHPGTPVLHTERFTRGKGLFHAIEFRPPAEGIDDEFPLQLTGPILPSLPYRHYDEELTFFGPRDA